MPISAIGDTIGIVIDGKGYCPLDDLRGIVIVEASEGERMQLIDHRFRLPMEQ